MATRSRPVEGQPGTTWDNLKIEVVPRFGIDSQALTNTGDGWDNLFESLTRAREKAAVLLRYKGSWQKVVPSVPLLRKPLGLYSQNGDNLQTEVVPGCPPVWFGGAV
jgi:hypothetical protein